MNLERTKPETLAAAALDLTPSQSLAAHEYAERLNAALARLGLTERLTLPSAPATAIDELPAVVDVPLRKTLSVLMGKAQQGDASALATLEMAAQVMESIFAGLHARASVYPLALPSHESLATLPQGVDALLPRKISTGWSVASLLADPTCDGIDDGVSLVRLFCTDAIDSVTELKDDNEGWVMTKALPSLFANLKVVNLSAQRIEGKFTAFGTIDEFYSDTLESIGMPADKTYGHYPEECFLAKQINSEELTLPALRKIYNGAGSNTPALGTLPNCKRIVLQSLSDVRTNGSSWLGTNTGSTRLANAPECLELITNIGGDTNRNNASASYVFVLAPKLQKFVLGGVLTTKNDKGLFNTTSPDLIHLEIGGATCSLYMQEWNPTSVLSDSERLPIFLSNFKTYIANRLTDKGSGLTLTLSQAVRDAIEGDPTIAQIITSKGWTISPAPSV